MSSLAVTDPVPIGPGVLPGLVFAFRFRADGIAEVLPVSTPIAIPPSDGGWLWLHFNLADQRACHWLAAAPLPAAARTLLVALHDHQQLYAATDCIYGVFCDLVRDLDGALDRTAYLNFSIGPQVIVTGRRQSLQAVDVMQRALADGRKVASPAALIEGIVGEVAAGIDRLLEDLARELDRTEDMILIEEVADERRLLGRVRRTCVHLHRQLQGLKTVLRRFDESDEEIEILPAISLATDRLAQRFDALDQEVVSVQERARLMQDEIAGRLSEESARNINVLAILSVVFLPATLVTGIFGMNTAGLPLTADRHGSLWAIAIVIAAAAFTYWLLRRMGVIKR